jgi:hypothetical protein
MFFVHLCFFSIYNWNRILSNNVFSFSWMGRNKSLTHSLTDLGVCILFCNIIRCYTVLYLALQPVSFSLSVLRLFIVWRKSCKQVGALKFKNWTTGWPGFDPRQRQRIFPIASVSRPALGLTQPPTQWVPGVKHGWGVMLISHLYLVIRSRMSRSYTSFPPCHLHGGSGTPLLDDSYHPHQCS